MDAKLFSQALTKFLIGVVIFGLLIFLPAGSFHYWQGWLMMGILFGPMFLAGIILMVKNPDLLRKRLNAKEEEREQKSVVAYIPLVAKRIRNEETVLEQGLEGYAEYKQRVKYKVIPYIW